MKGRLYIISGPSGSGKSTITKKVRDILNMPLAISATTRKIRQGEIDGKDYYFLTKEEFIKKIDNNEFFEYMQVHGNYYGTLLSEIDKHLEKGTDVILEIDTKGALLAKQKMPSAILIFCRVENEKVLEQRLRDRKTDSEEVIEIRLKNAKDEMQYEKHYDYTIINRQLDIAIQELISIIKKEDFNEKG